MVFKFTDKKIDSQHCQPEVKGVSHEDGMSIEFGFTVKINNEKSFFTESELQYMMDEVKKLKNTNWSC